MLYVLISLLSVFIIFALLLIYSIGARRGKSGLAAFGAGLDAIRAGQQQVYGEIKYADLVGEVLQNKPDDLKVKKCGVMRAKLPNGDIELTIVYLDDNAEPVWGDAKKSYGFKKRTKKLDSELLDYFGDKDILIFD